MRILLDECVDPKCAQFFSTDFEVQSMRDMGWLGIKNGELVRRASGQFDVLFTIDTNMRFQTNISGLDLAVAIAEGRFRSVLDYQEPIFRLNEVAATLEKAKFHVI